MIQKISVRILVEYKNRPLMLRRSDGRESLLGKYELPGGKVFEDEQPDDAAKRYLREDAGFEMEVALNLADVFTYRDPENRDFQYAVIVYRATVIDKKPSVRLSGQYDKYSWYHLAAADQAKLTELTQIIIGLPPVSDSSRSEDRVDSDEVFVYTDGASRGNPGQSAAGYAIVDQGKVIDQGSIYLGITTNNIAEYQGVILGLEAAREKNFKKITLRIDSLLVVNQMNGTYTIKNRELWPLNERIRELVRSFDRVRFMHIPRELNQLADGIANQELNAHESKPSLG